MLPVRRAIGENVTPINAAVVDKTLNIAEEVALKIAESGIDLENSGLASISDEAKVSYWHISALCTFFPIQHFT